MDVNVSLACKKAIRLCNYMLHTTNDDFVRKEKLEIEILMLENNAKESAAKAKEVSRYIRNNFDNIIGENVVTDINSLLDRSP